MVEGVAAAVAAFLAFLAGLSPDISSCLLLFTTLVGAGWVGVQGGLSGLRVWWAMNEVVSSSAR